MNPTKEEILEVLGRAQKAFMEKDYHSALKDYLWIEQNIQDDPDNLPIIWIEIAWNYYLLQNYPQAIEYLEKASKDRHLSQKQLFDCLRLLGFSNEYAGNFDKAIAYLQDALAQEVEEALKKYAYFELGKIFFQQNLPGEARPYLQKALALFSSEDSDYIRTTKYYLGFIAFLENDNQQAETYFLEIIAEAPDSSSQASGYFGLAHLFYEKKQYSALIDACNKVAALDKNFYDKETLGFFRCRGFMELKMWDELGVFLPKMIKQYPHSRYKTAYPTFKKALRDRKVPESFQAESKNNSSRRKPPTSYN